MKYTNLVLIIFSIPIIVAVILFHIKFTSKYHFENFMLNLEGKYEEIRTENINNTSSFEYEGNDLIYSFRKVFGHYYDNGGLTIALNTLLSVFIVIITIIEVICLILIQLMCKFKNCCKKCCSFFAPVHSMFNMVIYIYLAFDAKYEVYISDDILLHIFGKEFYEEIKENIDYMKNRKTILIICAFVLFISLGIELAMVIINHINEKKERNSNNAIPMAVISTESSQNTRKNSNEKEINYNNLNVNTN